MSYPRDYSNYKMMGIIGTTVAFTLLFNVLFKKNPEIISLRKEIDRGINYSVDPERRDVDGNGVDDFVFTTLGGDNVALYGHRDGSYSFFRDEREDRGDGNNRKR